MLFLRLLLVGFLMITTIVADHSSEGNLKKLGKANNDFALRLYSEITRSSSGNIFISPLSISMALAMLYHAARDLTQQELHNVLGYSSAGLDGDLVLPTIQRMLSNVTRNGDYTLEIANAILIDEDLQVWPKYNKEVSRIFNALVKNVDFTQNSEEVVADINQWVETATHGKISNIIESLDARTVMIILNAVYFKGKWKHPFFLELTGEATFYNNGQISEQKDVDTMLLEAKLPFTEAYNCQILELPYEGNDISMLILLPKHLNGLSALEDELDFEMLDNIIHRLRNTSVMAMVSLPKFKLSYSKELSGEMKNLGARSIFNHGANMDGMTPWRNVTVSEVLHKAVIEVNEEGTEAAAVTTMFMLRAKVIRPIIANHPFLFVIVEKHTDMILFIGRVKEM